MKLLRILACVWISVVAAAMTARAQQFAEPVTVPVGFGGSFLADGGESSNFEGYLADGGIYGSSWLTYAWYDANLGIANMRPGKSYEVSVYGEGVEAWRMSFTPPSGYEVFVDDVMMRQHESSTPLWGMATFSVRIEGGRGRSAMPAGDCTSLTGPRMTWQVGLGSLKNGTGAGAIAFREDCFEGFTTNLGARASLFYDSPCTEVEVIGEPGTNAPRQVRSPQAVVDITEESDGLWLRFYPTGDVWTMSAGLYVVSGHTAFVSYRLTKHSATEFSIRKWCGSKWWETRAIRTDIWQWTLRDWALLDSGGNPVAYERIEEKLFGVDGLTEEITTKNGAGVVASYDRITYQPYWWGREVASYTRGYGTAGQTTSYTYHENYWASGSWGRVATVTRPDGSWTKYDYYDDAERLGQLKATYEPFMDSPATAAEANEGNCRCTKYDYAVDHNGKKTRIGSIETWTNGALTGNSGIFYGNETRNGMPVVVTTASDHIDPATTRDTISKRYREDADPTGHWYPGLPFSVRTAGGQIRAHAYTRGDFNPSNRWFSAVANGTYVQEFVIHGSTETTGNIAMSSWSGQSIEPLYLVPGKSYAEETIRAPWAPPSIAACGWPTRPAPL